ARSDQFYRQITAHIDDKGKISAYLISIDDDLENEDNAKIPRVQTADYKKVIEFYTNSIEKMYQLKKNNEIPPPPDFDMNEPVSGYIYITIQDEKYEKRSAKFFIRTEDGFWYKLQNDNKNSQSLLVSSSDEMRLVFYSAINSERFINAC
ncbi:MAG: hypothetical protein LBB07_01475, partial [Bifidobacteriaceae bacterium]|nr:hypothetical protein [Bifidobacteriaceae bacterium]